MAIPIKDRKKAEKVMTILEDILGLKTPEGILFSEDENDSKYVQTGCGRDVQVYGRCVRITGGDFPKVFITTASDKENDRPDALITIGVDECMYSFNRKGELVSRTDI